VHGEFFRDVRPVNTIMQVSCFIDPDWLVEIEADAVIDDAGGEQPGRQPSPGRYDDEGGPA